MEKTIYDLVRRRQVPTKAGEKTVWDKVGVLIIDESGKISVCLNAIPTGSWDGWLRAFQRQEDARTNTNGNGVQIDQLEEDLPF